METFQTFIVVLIIIIAVFYLLKIGFSKKESGGCGGCSENCCSCSINDEPSGQKQIYTDINNKK
ncbi:MAG: FeoB-associated Cys-rich membrane protein [Thermodesulfobacteriota bacterium]